MRLLITSTDRRAVSRLLRLASCANQLPQQHFLNNRSSRPFLPVKPREMNPTIYINAGDEGDTDDRGGRGWWGFQSSWRAPGFRPIIPHPKSPAREIPCQKLFTVCWDFSGLKLVPVYLWEWVGLSQSVKASLMQKPPFKLVSSVLSIWSLKKFPDKSQRKGQISVLILTNQCKTMQQWMQNIFDKSVHSCRIHEKQ